MSDEGFHAHMKNLELQFALSSLRASFEECLQEAINIRYKSLQAVGLLPGEEHNPDLYHLQDKAERLQKKLEELAEGKLNTPF